MSQNALSIVVADDTESGRAVIRSALRQAGYLDVRLAENAFQVLDLLKERRADVVLADWIMPEMDGLALTDQIRRLDDGAHHYTAVILFTVKEGVEPLVEAFEHGVDDYVQKPIDPRELGARVHAAGRMCNLHNALLETNQALAKINQRLKEMATTDPLTGLGNRRYLHRRLDDLLLETATRGGLTCCALLDLDNFKEINDTQGHDIGDEVLIGFAKRLCGILRPNDVVARLGGDEFALVLRFLDAQKYTPKIFERIIRSIEGTALATSQGEHTVTASMGVCTYRYGDTAVSRDMILKQADQRLYQCKAAGRNRVICK